jgi:hypothetical protein
MKLVVSFTFVSHIVYHFTSLITQCAYFCVKKGSKMQIRHAFLVINLGFFCNKILIYLYHYLMFMDEKLTKFYLNLSIFLHVDLIPLHKFLQFSFISLCYTVNKYEHYCKYLEHFMYKLLQAFKIISDNKESKCRSCHFVWNLSQVKVEWFFFFAFSGKTKEQIVRFFWLVTCAHFCSCYLHWHLQVTGRYLYFLVTYLKTRQYRWTQVTRNLCN